MVEEMIEQEVKSRNMKKGLILLAVVVVVVLLANTGLAFSVAYLSKDTHIQVRPIVVSARSVFVRAPRLLSITTVLISLSPVRFASMMIRVYSLASASVRSCLNRL